jgi:hypothetical protein
MTPSLEIGNGNWAVKSDSLLGYKTIDGKYYPREIDVTRATTGTRVNEDGLVELVPYNLLSYSEAFDNAYWSKLNSSVSTNNTNAPNGTLTAEKLTENSATSQHYVVRTAADFVAATTYTLSVYAKASERNWIALGFNNESNRLAWFNLSTGVVGTVQSNVLSTSIVSVGNGWYRCTMTATTTITNPWVSALIANVNGTTSYLGDGASGLFIWGAQLVEGTEPLEYLPTTDRLDIARIDYSTGSPALLVEPQRTNLLTWSEQFDNVAWTKSTTTITANTTIAPSGLMTSDTMAVSSSTSRVISANVLTAGTYTISVWAKVLSGSGIMRFNLTIDGAPTSSNFEPTTEWQRFTYTFTAATSATLISFRGLTFVGDLAIWGAQLEAGSYPTSYIPTTSASVTRNADVISKTGISSLIGQTEGTIFWEGQVNGFGLYPQLFDLNAGGNKYIQIYNDIISGNPTIGIYVQNVSLLLNNPNIATIAFNTNFKFALGYKANDYVVYLNGTQVFSNTTIGVPPTSNFGLGDVEQTASTSKKNVKAAALWKTRLTNDQLELLTGDSFYTYAEMASYYNYTLQ